MNDGRTSFTEQPAAAQVSAGAVPIHRILVVDDDPSLRLLITRTLIRVGHHVDAAEDGAVAWDILQRHDYDLLLTDCEMPRVSGVELVKKLRAARMDLRVVLVSGKMPEELNRLPWLRLAGTLAKPFSGDELMATVDDALRRTGDSETSAAPSNAVSHRS